MSIGNKALTKDMFIQHLQEDGKHIYEKYWNERFVDPHQYLELSKYNYPKYLIQDKDFERFF